MLQLALLIALTAQSLPEGPGKELVEVICTACHDANRIIAKQDTKAGWQSKVLEMLQECPDVAQDERDKIVNYLAKSFPKHVNVNTASANEIEAALELSSKDAEAIIQYREKNGKFRTADDVKNVPSIDITKVEQIRTRLDF